MTYICHNLNTIMKISNILGTQSPWFIMEVSHKSNQILHILEVLVIQSTIDNISYCILDIYTWHNISL